MEPYAKQLVSISKSVSSTFSTCLTSSKGISHDMKMTVSSTAKPDTTNEAYYPTNHTLTKVQDEAKRETEGEKKNHAEPIQMKPKDKEVKEEGGTSWASDCDNLSANSTKNEKYVKNRTNRKSTT